MSTLNYPVVIAIVIAAVFFIAWLTWRNLKDKKKFEEESNQSDLTPEKHDNKGDTRI